VMGRSRGSQVAPHTSSTSHGLRERGGGRWEQHGQQKSKVVMFTAPVFATSHMASGTVSCVMAMPQDL